jgi:hypothetical protein
VHSFLQAAIARRIIVSLLVITKVEFFCDRLGPRCYVLVDRQFGFGADSGALQGESPQMG